MSKKKHIILECIADGELEEFCFRRKDLTIPPVYKIRTGYDDGRVERILLKCKVTSNELRCVLQ